MIAKHLIGMKKSRIKIRADKAYFDATCYLGTNLYQL